MNKGLNTEEVSAMRNFGLERIRLRGVENEIERRLVCSEAEAGLGPIRPVF